MKPTTMYFMIGVTDMDRAVTFSRVHREVIGPRHRCHGRPLRHIVEVTT